MNNLIQSLPVASSIPFDNSTNSFISTDVQSALLEASQPPIQTLTEFEAFSSQNLQSTTSIALQVKTNFPYTTTSKTAGLYVIDFTKQVTNSDKQKRIVTVVDWRIGTTGAYTTLAEINEGVSFDEAWQLRSGFNIITLPTDNVFQVRIRWSATVDGGTARIRFASIKLGKVSSI
jgi:hypothetical protein